MEASIQDYLRVAATRARDSVRVGPFLATFSPQSADPFLNYAIPDRDAVPSSAEVAALITLYRRHNRKPRLEYVPGLAPAVESALLAEGFSVEQRLQIMVCVPETLHDLPVPRGILLTVPVSDEDLLAMAAVQHEAFGDPPPDRWDVQARRDHLTGGGLAIIARDAATAEPSGAGVCDAPVHHIAELAGIGVRPAFRRRGIAAAMTSRLTRDAFTAGATAVFLTAEHRDEQRIYARAGFSFSSDFLHISLSHPE